MINVPTGLDFLIPELRIMLNDISPVPKYQDNYLRAVLVHALKNLGRRWNNRYLINTQYVVSRNDEIVSYGVDPPPIIEQGDQYIICLAATILVKKAQIYDTSWDVSSWKDDEISYSNIQAAKERDTSLKHDLEELERLLTQRLYAGKVTPLPGFHSQYNTNEGGI